MTRSNIHLDRVASAWLIKSFVDPDAEFAFVDDASQVGGGSRAFGLADADIPPHDGERTCFDNVIARFSISAPGLAVMADHVRAAVAVVLSGRADHSALDVALAELAEGLFIAGRTDDEVLQISWGLFTGLYAQSWAAEQSECPDGTSLLERLLLRRNDFTHVFTTNRLENE